MNKTVEQWKHAYETSAMIAQSEVKQILSDWSATTEKYTCLLNRAKDLLEDCEFADNTGGEYNAVCPICERAFDHAKDCELDLFLTEIKEA